MLIRLAFLCVLQFALSGNAFAQDTVADCDRYAASDTDPNAKAPGVPLERVNPTLAVPACAAAVRQFPNNPRLLFQLGRTYRAADNFNLALEYYRKAAEQNYAAAQNSLGYAYANGQSVPPNDQQAVAWYRKAAEQGLAAAQNNLGVMYLNGKGVPKDTQQAAAWFHKAAEQGLLSARSNLDNLYPPGQAAAPLDAPLDVGFTAMVAETGCESRYSADKRADIFEAKYNGMQMTVTAVVSNVNVSRGDVLIEQINALPDVSPAALFLLRRQRVRIMLNDPKNAYDLLKGQRVTVRFTVRSAAAYGNCTYLGDQGVFLP